MFFLYPLSLKCYTYWSTTLPTFSLLVIRYLVFMTVYHRLFVLLLLVAYSGHSRDALLVINSSVYASGDRSMLNMILS
jgi:hypothetical protein